MAIFTKNANSYKGLVKEVTTLLGFLEPLYSTLNAASNAACVVVFGREGANPYFRVGKVCADLLESEESAVDHCLQTLVTTFGLCVRHMAKPKCEQCEKCESYLSLSLTNGDVEGIGSVQVKAKTCIHSSQDECTTPTDPAYQIPCSSIPPPPKKHRVS